MKYHKKTASACLKTIAMILTAAVCAFAQESDEQTTATSTVARDTTASESAAQAPDTAGASASDASVAGSAAPDAAVAAEQPPAAPAAAVSAPPAPAAAAEPSIARHATPASALPGMVVRITGSITDEQKRVLEAKVFTELSKRGLYGRAGRSAQFAKAVEKELVRRGQDNDDENLSRVAKRSGIRYVGVMEIAPVAVYGTLVIGDGVPRDGEVDAFYVSFRIIDAETAEVSAIGDVYSYLDTDLCISKTMNELNTIMFGEEAEETPVAAYVPPPKERKKKTKPSKRSSIGVGGFFNYDESSVVSRGRDIDMRQMSGGGYLLFDAEYFTLTVGYSNLFSGEWEFSRSASGIEPVELLSRSSLSTGVYLKYPFYIRNKKNGKYSKIFPLVGAEFDMTLSAKIKLSNGREIDCNGGEYPLYPDGIFVGYGQSPERNEFDAISFRVGFGTETDIGSRMYLRSEAMFVLRPPNDFEEKSWSGADYEAYGGNGIVGKIAIGYRF